MLIDAILVDGLVGHAILFTYTAAALAPVADLVRNIGALLEGQALAPSALTDQLLVRFR